MDITDRAAAAVGGLDRERAYVPRPLDRLFGADADEFRRRRTNRVVRTGALSGAVAAFVAASVVVVWSLVGAS